VLTTGITSIGSDISTWLSSGYVFRFRFSVPVSVWVVVSPGVAFGNVAVPDMRAPQDIYNFIPLPYPNPAGITLASLVPGSKVLLFKAGQSNWQGGGPDGYSGLLPQKTKYWNGTAFVFIKDGGYRGSANPSYYFANKFETLYPNLELLLVEGGEGGSGFYGGKWEIGGALRTSVLASFAAGYNAAKAITDKPVYLWGMTWNQGEADADTVPHAVAYATDLPLFVGAVKTAINNTSLKFVPTRLNDSLVGYNQLNAIRAVHETFIPFVDIDSVPMHTDNIHYTATGYTQIGQRQFDTMASVNLNQINTVTGPPPPGPTILDYDLKGLSALPSGFTLSSGTIATFNANYTEVVRGATNNWSLKYLTSPVLNWVDYDVSVTFTPQGLSTVGVSLDYSPGIFSGSGESFMVTTSGDIFYKGNSVASIGTTLTSFTTYTLVFSKTSSTPTTTTVVTGVTPTFIAPRVIADSAYSDLRMIRIREQVKVTVPTPPEPVNVILLSGQSNLMGEPYTQAYSGPLPTKAKYWDDTTNTFVPFVLRTVDGTRPAEGAGFPGYHGPIPRMLADLESRYPGQTFYIVYQDSPGNGFGSGANSFGPGGSDRIEFMKKIDRADSWLGASGLTFKYSAHLLHQGEHETMVVANGTNYLSQLQSYYRDIRSRTNAALPCVAVRLSLNNTRFTNTATRDAVRSAQTTASTAIIDVDNATTFPMFADADTFVRHFTALGSTNIGLAWAALTQLNPANGLASVNNSAYVVPGPALGWDFTQLTALPSGFSFVGASAPTFSTGGITLVAGGSVWGASKVIGPAWDQTRPLVFKFRSWVTTNAGMGAIDGSGDWSLIVGKSVMAIRQAGYTGNVNTGGFPVFIANTDYRATFNRQGPDVQLLVHRLNTDGSINSLHGVVIFANADLPPTAKISVDGHSTAIRVYAIAQ
jgi:hypothetical protein